MIFINALIEIRTKKTDKKVEVPGDRKSKKPIPDSKFG